MLASALSFAFLLSSERSPPRRLAPRCFALVHTVPVDHAVADGKDLVGRHNPRPEMADSVYNRAEGNDDEAAAATKKNVRKPETYTSVPLSIKRQREEMTKSGDLSLT